MAVADERPSDPPTNRSDAPGCWSTAVAAGPSSVPDHATAAADGGYR